MSLPGFHVLLLHVCSGLCKNHRAPHRNHLEACQNEVESRPWMLISNYMMAPHPHKDCTYKSYIDTNCADMLWGYCSRPTEAINQQVSHALCATQRWSAMIGKRFMQWCMLLKTTHICIEPSFSVRLKPYSNNKWTALKSRGGGAPSSIWASCKISPWIA